MNSEILFTLNRLGRSYHTYFGYDDHPVLVYSSQLDVLLHASENGCQIISESNDVANYSDIVTKVALNNDYSEGFEVYYDKDDMIRDSDTELHYDKITVMYEKDRWYGKPRDWYNEPTRWFAGVNRPHLPYLKSRAYIAVEERFMRVSISAIEKGNVITLDDILFATRALAVDESRTYESFTILKDNGPELFLAPTIDNYST